VHVHEAHIQDRDGAVPLLQQVAAVLHTVLLVFFDSAYAGRLVDWVGEVLGWRVEVVRRPEDGNGAWSEANAPLRQANNAAFPLLPRRWVVERTFAWLGRYRRLSKDYEALIEVSEAMLWLASLHLLTRRLAA
jgi:putative transposase